MTVTGWRVAGQLPAGNRLVVIAAPHTTNWDFIYLIAAALVFRLKIHWLGKTSLFRPPMGTLMRLLGGIPVDRSRSTNLVAQLKAQFEASRGMAIVIPPSGTRGKTDHWKSGFYWTAYEAGATVVCGYLNYPSKTAGLGYSFEPTGNVSEDIEPVRAFYKDIVGKYPELASEVRLAEEHASK